MYGSSDPSKALALITNLCKAKSKDAVYYGVKRILLGFSIVFAQS